MNDADIAKALRMLHRECANMAGPDVAALWQFLQQYPDLHTNGIRKWQGVMDSEGTCKDDEANVAQAIGRFRKHVPVRKV